ncbi:P-TEFb-associated cyclin-dependent protein kinase Cdk9 [Chamberlinius hualienensis]
MQATISKEKLDASKSDKYSDLENLHFPYCDDVGKYDKLGKIGQGTFGEVYKARHKVTRNLVALKKVLMENEKEGFPITALREIRILQPLKHDNVVSLIEICRSKGEAAISPTQFNRYKSTFYLVFEFCEHDLAGLLSNTNVKFSLAEIKNVMKQLLEGLYFIHSNEIIHRDMKSANILITKNGILKLADFGLARGFKSNTNGKTNRFTNRVVTLWYRPPELLLGERNYGSPVDLWGAGCIMAELWTRRPIMQGSTEQTQLKYISQLCGSINKEVWPNVEQLPLFGKIEMPNDLKRKVKEKLTPYVKDNHALDLIDKLLTLDPRMRIISNDALSHDFFWSDPMPCNLAKMLSNHTQSMFEFLIPSLKKVEQQPSEQPQKPQSATQGQFHTRIF